MLEAFNGSKHCSKLKFSEILHTRCSCLPAQPFTPVKSEAISISKMYLTPGHHLGKRVGV